MFMVNGLRDSRKNLVVEKDFFISLINFFVSDQMDYRTKEILTFALTAIEGFSSDVMVWCVGEHDTYCRFRTMFDNVDQIYTIDK